MRRECDLVMKGGVTSGVVYPPAIYQISRTFDLRSIGGTSAGAIAAALAAAAQYRRIADAANPEAGYDALAALPAWLGSGNHLFGLFAPPTPTRRLFDTVVALAAPGKSGPQRIGELLKAHRYAALAGGSAGLLHLLAAGSVDDPARRTLHRIFALFGFLSGAVAGAGIGLAMDVLRTLPRNSYGLVTGVDAGNADALCTWLAAKTEELAGLPAGEVPLTFGMLWNPGAGAVPNGLAEAPADPRIDLRMMTTNIVEGRPYLFPTRTSEYRFRESDMHAFFPPHVVRWMLEHARQSAHAYQVDGEPLTPLPPVGDLPVLVATRMSLAFPVLLGAVPLYVVDHPTGKPPVPRRVLFSDGGLSSNFPIALFDSPLPRRPTLAMNLGGFPPDADASTPDIVMVAGNEPAVIYPPNAVGDFPSFLSAIFGTIQNWNDAVLARLPGYRDRIITIRLRDSEGGLNLDMDAATVAALADRGKRAGDMLVERFAAPSACAPCAGAQTMSWENHRWVRYRTIMNELRDLLAKYHHAWESPAEGDVSYHQLIEAAGHLGPHSYRFPDDENIRNKLIALSAELAELGDALAQQPALTHNEPHPPAALVTRAQLDYA